MATIASPVRLRMERHGDTEEGVLQIFYKSAMFPTANYGNAHNCIQSWSLRIKMGHTFYFFIVETEKVLKALASKISTKETTITE